MSRPQASGDIDPRILDEAADWLMRLHDSQAGADPASDHAADRAADLAADRAAWARWQATSPEHARAWARAEQLLARLGGLPPELAMPALDRRDRMGRRAAITRLAALLAVVPAGWAAWQVAGDTVWLAEHRAGTGERRDLRLADGSEVTLNTGSGIDVRFSASERFIRLRSGDMLVQTAPDTAVAHRPFRVGTAEGRLEALGTRFTVRQGDGRTQLVVLAGAVRITPAAGGDAAGRVLQAGEQAWFSRHAVEAVRPADTAATAWTQGMLFADRMRLADFAQELGRYRAGIVRVDPAVADLRVSGAYPVSDSDQALAMLAATYPLAVHARLGGYWLTLAAR